MAKFLLEKGVDKECRISAKDFDLCIDLKEKKLDDEKMKVIIKKAEKALEAPINILPVSHYKLYETKGDRKETQDGYYERREAALNLAYAECYERQGRFTDKLVDIIWAIMEETTWVTPAHHRDNTRLGGDRYLPSAYNHDQLHGICLFAASTAAALSMVYYLCKDILDEYSPVISERIKFSVRERITKPYIQCRFWWSGESGGRVLNWCPWITSNILLSVGLLEDDEYLRGRVLEKAIVSIDAYSNNGAMADGGCDEGPGYWGAAGAAYFDCLELLYDFSGGKVDIFSEPYVRDMMEFIVKVNVHGKRFLNFSDCAPESTHNPAMLRRMGEKCGSEVLRSFADVMEQYDTPAGIHGHPYRGYRSLITPAGKSEKSIGIKRVWLPAMKIMAAREFDDTSLGMMVAVTGGTNGTAHSHNDIGNVTVYYCGKPVLIDTGAGAYTRKTFSKDRYTLWYMQSCYHNVADINGKGQKNGWDYRSSDEVYDEKTGGVTMQLATAYEKEVGVKSYVRSCVLDGGTVRIKDSFELETLGEVDIHFISAYRPTLRADGKIELAEGRVMSFDEELKPEIEAFAVDDVSQEQRWGSDTLYRIHLRAKIVNGEFDITLE